MNQTQIIAQQTSFPNAFPCEIPQYFAPLPPIQGGSPPLPCFPGYTPVIVGGPMLPPMQNSFPSFPMQSPLPMQDFNSSPLFTMCPPQSHSLSASPMMVPVSPMPMFVSPPVMNLNSPPSMEPQQNGLLQPFALVSNSRSLSPATSESCDGFYRERTRSLSRDSAEKSKKELVDEALAELSKDFGSNFDTDGLRGQNIVRIKVKTRVALESIVSFIRFCQRENLLERVSCPISTKKGRQHVRGFLAYLQTRNERDSDRVCDLFAQFNATHDSPFKAYQRNPKSTLYKNMGAAA